MNKRSLFLFLTVAMFSGLTFSSSSLAQGYFVKKNKSGGFFSRMFGSGKQEKQKQEQEQEEKTKKEKPKKTKSVAKKKEAPPPAAYDYDLEQVKAATYTDSFEFEDFNPEDFDLDKLQKEIMGECTEQDMAIHEEFEKAKEDSEKAIDRRTKKQLEHPRNYDSEEEEKRARKNTQDEEDDVTVVKMLSTREKAGASIMATMRCKSINDMIDEKKISKERRAARGKIVEKVSEREERLLRKASPSLIQDELDNVKEQMQEKAMRR